MNNKHLKNVILQNGNYYYRYINRNEKFAVRCTPLVLDTMPANISIYREIIKTLYRYNIIVLYSQTEIMSTSIINFNQYYYNLFLERPCNENLFISCQYCLPAILNQKVSFKFSLCNN